MFKVFKCGFAIAKLVILSHHQLSHTHIQSRNLKHEARSASS